MKTYFTQVITSFRFGVIFMLLAIILLSGCQDSVMLMPTPQGLRDKRFDVFAHNPNIEKNNKISVFYATNRLSWEGDSGKVYTKSFDHSLRFGEAVLQIGPDDLAWDELYAESRTSTRKDKFEIALIETKEMGLISEEGSPEEISQALKNFFLGLNQAISESPLKTLTIYVHGANSSFYRATAQGAQYRYFTGSKAVLLVFSWPSAENILKYTTDVKHTQQTAPDFIRLVKLMAKYSRAERIHILAYSAGGRLSGDALGRLGKEYEKANAELIRKKFRFGQLYLTSSDEDLYEFIDYLPRYSHLFEGITLTFDKVDSVLGFAKITDGQLRLGRPPKDAGSLDLTDAQNEWLTQIINSDRFNIINLEINIIPGFKFSHSAWYENTWVSTDVITTLNLGLSPEQRGLEKYKGYLDRDVWYFPPDYLKKLKTSLLQRKK
jgi:esterase/lipase superfamily enzyme